jgi:putative DNA primase/helicase
MNNHTPILEAAREYVSKGCCVIPIKKNTKEPLIEWKEYQGRIPIEGELIKWFENTDNQLGIVTGSISGNLFILDFDGENFEESFLEFLTRFPKFQSSFLVRSGSGKYHIYGKCDHFDKFFKAFTKKTKGYPNGHVELRVNGHQTLAPPSIHPSGNHYEVLYGTDWITISLSELYEILEWINPEGNGKDTKKPEGWADEIITQGVSEGERNTALVKLAGRHLGKKLSKVEILPILLEANSRFDPPLDEVEVESILDSMIKTDERKKSRKEFRELRAKGKPAEPVVDGAPAPEAKQQAQPTAEDEEWELIDKDFSDTENARRFLKFYPDTYLWIEDLSRWWHFDPERPGWGLGEMGVRSEMKETANKINELVLRVTLDDTARIGKLKQCVSWKDANGIENSIKMLRDESYSQSTEFDTDPFLFLCKSGVIDLRTIDLRSIKPSDRLHKLSPVVFDPKAECPQWEQFLDETFMNNRELIIFIQKFCGYTLTANTREEKFLILEGGGQNGKSTLLEVMAGILGEYGIPVPFATFKDAKWDQGGNAHQADIVQLIGARFIRSVEVKERARLNVERLKSLTGNDMMSARPPHARDYIKFYPVGKIWLAVNHLPKIYDTTSSCWRRLLRIPFSYIVPPEKRILDFSKKLLREESSGILNWMLDGCLVWQHDGIEPIPEVVLKATEEYQLASTPVRRFVSEEYQTGQFQVLCKDFYDSFIVWWKREFGEIEPVSRTEVGLELRRLGFNTRTFKNRKYYIGLKPKDYVPEE